MCNKNKVISSGSRISGCNKISATITFLPAMFTIRRFIISRYETAAAAAATTTTTAVAAAAAAEAALRIILLLLSNDDGTHHHSYPEYMQQQL